MLLKHAPSIIQTISTLHDDEILPSNPADLFHWLPKEHMCVLVYLVSPCRGRILAARVRGEGFSGHHHLTLSPGDCDALHASWLPREGAEVHRQGPHAAGEAQE